MKFERFERKLIALTLALAMLICIMPATKRVDASVGITSRTLSSVNYYWPQDYNEGDKDDKSYGKFKYREDETGKIVITKYTGSEKKVTVPAKIDGKEVVCVFGAFHDNKTITEVVLPSTVTRIEYEAFSGAENLTTVNIDYLKRIGSFCFTGCNLGDVVLPEGLVDCEGAFSGAHLKSLTISDYLADTTTCLGSVEVDDLRFKDGIKRISLNMAGINTPELVIPDSVTDIEYARFGYGNKKVILGKGITKISSRQFGSSCYGDVEIVGENVTVIDKWAFFETNIKSLIIPDSVTEIQYNAFRDTYYLSDITFSNNLTKIVGGYNGCLAGSLWYDNQEDGVVYTGSALYAYKGSVPENTRIDVKKGTKGIGYMALQTEDCSSSNITKVTLPTGLLYIGGASFFNTGIKEINIPDTVTEIGPGAFGNTNIKSVFIPKSVKTIGKYAFGYQNNDLKGNNEVWVVEDFIAKEDEDQYGYSLYIKKRMNEKNEIEEYNYSNEYVVFTWKDRYNDFFGTGNSSYEGNVHKANKVQGFTIIGYKGSAAEKYAKANGFTFIEAKDGIYTENGGEYYYQNNALSTGTTDVLKDVRSGKWYNVVKGKVTVGPTVAKNSFGWWYVDKTGKVDFGFTGFASNSNGTWYLKNGKVQFGTYDVIRNAADGKWYNVVGGKVTGGPTVAKNSLGWWYIGKNGAVDFGYTGFASNKYGTWYIKGGKVQFGKYDVIRNTADGKWYNVVGGKVTGGPTVAKNSFGWWYISKNGAVDFGYTGFASNKYGTWYIKGGKVQFGTKDIIRNTADGKWYNVVGGKVTGGPTVAKNSFGWWYIGKNGAVDFSYTGIATNSYGTWYIKSGKVQFGYTGNLNLSGKTYTIKGGKVVK